MLNPLPGRMLWRSFNWLTRFVIVVFATVVVLVALTIMSLRYLLLPDIEQYHDQITAFLAAAIGNPVTIGKIEGDWQGFQPRLDFSDVRILDEQRQPALVLKGVSISVSWMSLFTAQLRLASLEIDQPELLIRRDVHGEIFIGGVALSKKGGDNDLPDWLLHQSRMVVRDALIVWVDEFRDAPPLVLRKVNFRIESLFSHHRFALRALPPEDLATPLDVRGDFYGKSFHELENWHGNIFTQLDFSDITAWRKWLDLPKEFSQGRSALRGWLNVEGGKVTGVTADMALYNVVAKLAEDTPEMVLTNLHGRAAWQEVKGGFEVSTQGLALRLQNGIELHHTDFYFRTAKADKEQPGGGELRANLLQLDGLVSLAKYLPLQADLRSGLDAYAPSGRVTDLGVAWQGTLEKPDNLKIKGRFDNLAVRQVGKMPGFSGFTADVDGSDASGSLNIDAHKMVVDAPGVMREPVPFAALTGQIAWQRRHGELSITINNVAAANDDLAGKVYGSYQTQAGTLGVLDLTANLTRGDIRRAARYTPLIALNKEGNDWLNGALQAGVSRLQCTVQPVVAFLVQRDQRGITRSAPDITTRQIGRQIQHAQGSRLRLITAIHFACQIIVGDRDVVDRNRQFTMPALPTDLARQGSKRHRLPHHARRIHDHLMGIDIQTSTCIAAINVRSKAGKAGHFTDLTNSKVVEAALDFEVIRFFESALPCHTQS